MERRSWPWKRKSSSDKSPGGGETESSGSVSSHSERCSDDQDASKTSPTTTSPNNAQSPEVSSDANGYEVNGTIKSLNEKLSAALLNIKAKEDLVKQHIKVAEEAVSGWEEAETETAALKQQLETLTEENSTLKDRIGHLDGALKECVRQLRQSREEQEQKVHDALIKKTNDLESTKSALKRQLIDLQTQLEAKSAASATSVDHHLSSKVEALEKENSSFKVELLAQAEDIQKLILERELSIGAAEAASKQHLESIKKVAKLEAELRQFKATSRKLSSVSYPNPLTNSACAESLTDSQSDSADRFGGTENEHSCSDSWASALIAELDQFKNEKVVLKDLTASTDIDLMDDFLEMERLAALPEADRGSSSLEVDVESGRAVSAVEPTKAEVETIHRKVAELEEKVEKMVIQKSEMEIELSEAQDQLEASTTKLVAAEEKLVDLKRQLSSSNASIHIFEIKSEAAEAKRMELESQLKSRNQEVMKLFEDVGILEVKVKEQKERCSELEAKCRGFKAVEAKRNELESQLEAANFEINKLHDKMGILEREVREEKTLAAELISTCQNMEDIDAKSKGFESQLKSAQSKIEELTIKVSLFEQKIEEERAFSAELAAKLEAAEAEKSTLKSQLELAYIEASTLREGMKLLEKEVGDAREVSAEYAAKYETRETNEAKSKALESHLKLAHLEIDGLLEKSCQLEVEVQLERALAAEFAANLEVRETSKMDALESQLKSAHSEVEMLRGKVKLLERKVEESVLSAEIAAHTEVEEAMKMEASKSQFKSAHSEDTKLFEKKDLLERKVNEGRVLSADYATRCQDLEDKLSRRVCEAEVRHPTCTNGDPDAKQKEVVVAAGKLAECQRTIASLGQQLKLLATFEDFMHEGEKLDFDGTALDHRGGVTRTSRSSYPSDCISFISTRENGKERESSPTSSSSSLG